MFPVFDKLELLVKLLAHAHLKLLQGRISCETQANM